jgi:hypothetical protein
LEGANIDKKDLVISSGLRKFSLWFVLIWLTYVICGSLLLNSSWFHSQLNKNPDQISIEWQSAITLFPGHFRGKSLNLGRISSRVSSYTIVDNFSGWLMLDSFANKQLKISWLKLTNVYSRILPHVYISKLEDSERVFLPDITGGHQFRFGDNELQGPLKPGWAIDLSGITISGKQKYWIANYQLSFIGELNGDIIFRKSGALEVDDGVANIQDFKVLFNNLELVEKGNAVGNFQVDPFIPYFYPGLAKLEFLSSDIITSGQLHDLSALNSHLGIGPQSRGLSGMGSFVGRSVISNGMFVSPTKLKMESTEFTFHSDKFSLTGTGLFRLNPSETSRNQQQKVSATLSNVSVFHAKKSFQVIHLDNLDIALVAKQFGLSSSLDEPEVTVTLEKTELPDITILNRFLPASKSSTFLEGTANIEGVLKWARGLMTGRLKIGGEKLLWRLNNNEIGGKLGIDLKLEAALESRKLSLAGSTIQIASTGLRNTQGKDWNAQFELDEAGLQFNQSVEALRKSKLPELVNFTDGKLLLHGFIDNLGIFSQLLPGNRPVALSGPGVLHANLSLQNGSLESGSRFDFQSDSISAGFLDFNAVGKGRIHVKVAGINNQRQLRMELIIRDVQITSSDSTQGFIKADRIDINVSGYSQDFTESVREVSATVRIPQAIVPDIRVYNSYLPEGDIIRLVEGVGMLSGKFDFSDESAQAKVRLVSPQIKAIINGLPVGFDMDLELKMSNRSMNSRKFALDNSYLRIKNLSYRSMPSTAVNWKGEFKFVDGELMWTRPVELNSTVNLQMTSSAPLIDILMNTKGYLKLIRKFLSVEDVSGQGQLHINNNSLVLNDLNITGEDLLILAKLRLREKDRKGILYSKLGRLDATVEFENNEREWFLLSPRTRYENYPSFK